MSELLTIDEVEKLAHKVWYAQFEKETKILLAQHKKNIEAEFSVIRKYKSEIYRMFETLKSIQIEVKHKLMACDYSQKEIRKGLTEMKEIKKKIQHTERKLSYALGDPYDKRNLKREFQKDEPEAQDDIPADDE